jgi:5-methylcytosine-specific restriction endonuclease McrA
MLYRSYALALRDPRWRKKRFLILAEHRYKCDDCSLRRAGLEVHHIEYIEGRAPWDYSSDYFAVLCRNCHARRHFPINPDEHQACLFSDQELSPLLQKPYAA